MRSTWAHSGNGAKKNDSPTNLRTGLGIVLKLLMVTVTHDLYRYLYLETPDWFKHYKSPFSVCKMLGAKLQAPLEPPGSGLISLWLLLVGGAMCPYNHLENDGVGQWEG